MALVQHIAKHFRDVYFGGNWTEVALKQHLDGMAWQQAITTVYGLNSIATLVVHLNYYVTKVTKVFEGQPLDAKDVDSFDLPPIESQDEWDALVNKTWTDAEHFALLLEKLPEHLLWQDFTDKKYGSYYTNIHGIIEHVHYHLGQIVLIKKIIAYGGH